MRSQAWESGKSLPVPKLFQQEVLKQATSEEGVESLVDGSKLSGVNGSERGGEVKRQRSKKTLVYMNDEYARVDKVTLQDKRDRASHVEWRLRDRSDAEVLIVSWLAG